MTNDEILHACLNGFLLLVLLVEIVLIVRAVIKYRREEQRESWQFYAKAEYSKRDADKHGIEYAFGKAECDERKRITKTIDSQSHRGLYSCELDFPVSQRSLEWLRYSGFEVSQTEGITKVSWENAEEESRPH